MSDLAHYTFSDQHLQAFKVMAAWRATPKETFASTRAWSNNAFWGHFLGVVGEYTVAHYTAGFFDPMPKVTGDRHAPDVVLSNGDGIAVKTTRYAPAICKVNGPEDVEQASHVALCHYAQRQCRLCWVLPVEDFMSRAFTRDFGHGDRLCLGETPMH